MTTAQRKYLIRLVKVDKQAAESNLKRWEKYPDKDVDFWKSKIQSGKSRLAKATETLKFLTDINE